MLIAIIFLHFFYVVSYLEGGALCQGSTLVDLLQKSETDSQKRSYFSRFMILGQKINKTGTDLK